MIDIFSEGYKKTDKQLNGSRAAVNEEIEDLMDEIPENGSLVNLSMRIPGHIQNNRYISKTFNVIAYEFSQSQKVLKEVLWDVSTGPQGFYIIEKDPGLLKADTIKFETENPLGPISNFDVYSIDGDKASPISRAELGAKPRKCIVCDKEGHECRQNDNHSIEELHQAISKIMFDNVNFEIEVK